MGTARIFLVSLQISLNTAVRPVWVFSSSIAAITPIWASLLPVELKVEKRQYFPSFSSKICITEIGIRSCSRWIASSPSPSSSGRSMPTADAIHFCAPERGMPYSFKRVSTVSEATGAFTSSFKNCSRRIGRLLI